MTTGVCPRSSGVLLLLAAVSICSARAEGAPLDEHRSTGAGPFEGLDQMSQWVMGTRLTMAVAVPAGQDPRVLLSNAFEIVREWDRLLSTYRAASEISRLNRSQGRAAIAIDGRVWKFLMVARSYAERTRGAFSIAAGGLLRLQREDRPAAARLRDAIAEANGQPFSFTGSRRVRLASPRVALDPGGIGKGYALDAVVHYLRDRGVKRAFLDFGGSSFYGIGKPSAGRGWLVLLRGAAWPERGLGVACLHDQALSSSFSLKDASSGHGQAHIIDPRTGALIHDRRFAAALAPTATEAEVLSTALVVAPNLQQHLASSFPEGRMLVDRGLRPPVATSKTTSDHPRAEADTRCMQFD